MPTEGTRSESWKKRVLRSMPAPAWLGADSPQGDVVVSTRFRYARNLRGIPFPHHCTVAQANLVAHAVTESGKSAGLVSQGRLTDAERDYLLGSRLISSDFEPRKPGREILLDKSRTLSVMVNEEDHLRIQALVGGWSPQTARVAASDCLKVFESRLNFAFAEPWGYLTASEFNCGGAGRWSALFHFIGLAHRRRLQSLLRALGTGGVTARGLFGESSRAVGAFFQVSTTRLSLPEFVGACELLLRQEREARAEVPRTELRDKFRQAVETAVSSPELDLREALRIFAWVRWASSVGLEGAPERTREVDESVSTMEVFGTQDPAIAARHRAEFVRQRLHDSWRSLRNPGRA